MERLTEGNRSQQIKLDRAPWTRQQDSAQDAKQLLWVTFRRFHRLHLRRLLLAHPANWRRMSRRPPGRWELFWVVFYGFATYGNAGFLREQVCKYMCPYARFQSAMFDRNTLVISYDADARRTARCPQPRRTPQSVGQGDCVDCTLCGPGRVPTGIDIRQGLQYECIACAACIDACDR